MSAIYTKMMINHLSSQDSRDEFYRIAFCKKIHSLARRAPGRISMPGWWNTIMSTTSGLLVLRQERFRPISSLAPTRKQSSGQHSIPQPCARFPFVEGSIV